MSFLIEIAVLLAAAVIAVPVARRLGLGSVLGYLAAGAAIGPAALGLVADVDSILHFAELGVVLVLFVIGLELQPGRLWAMRRPVLGLGVAQVGVTAAVLAGLAVAAGLAVGTAVLAGLTLALSSTAFALQILAERGEVTTRHGRSAFAILLFQDLAAIPLIALVPLFADGAQASAPSLDPVAALKTAVILVAVMVAGRYVLRVGLRLAAGAGVQEVFTAAALLTVVATVLLMEALGLSMALGAFLAGVLLADSEYRHALEGDLEPFKGLLLGLFFIAVGMSLDLGLIAREPATIAALVAGLVAVKTAIGFAIGRFGGLATPAARSLAIAIGQGGEFAFVVLTAAVAAGVVERPLTERLFVVVTLSMAATPLLFLAHDRVFARRRAADPAYEAPAGDHSQVIIAGFGRFGQMIGRILRARRIPFTALDISAEQIEFVGRYGNKVYYGDAARLDLLRAAKADRAVAFVLAIDDVEASVRTARVVRENFPELKVFARARNRQHAYRLMELGIRVVWRETFLSAIDMAEAVLRRLGLSDYQARRTVETFREHDELRLYRSFGAHADEARMQALAKKAARELEELFAEDVAEQEKGA
jgi:monovalent cation:proton antiporter-2 (CPA2) family protein